jgi:hypothetical protein
MLNSYGTYAVVKMTLFWEGQVAMKTQLGEKKQYYQ